MPQAANQATATRPEPADRPLSASERDFAELPFIGRKPDGSRSFWTRPTVTAHSEVSTGICEGALGHAFAIEALDFMREHPDRFDLLQLVAQDMIEAGAWSQLELNFWHTISRFAATGTVTVGITFADATATPPQH